MISRILLIAFLFVVATGSVNAQTSKAKQNRKTDLRYPKTFNISKSEFDGLFNMKTGEKVRSADNVYLNKATLLMNSRNGDIRFLRLKLNYFRNAYLIIQVNGEYSTQIFILSDDKSVFYKGAINGDIVVMTKCSEDDIVSE
jgi:hypothetical protein